MNVLAIGAHHDDIELGCGGTIAKLSAQGHTVYGLVLTDSETHYALRNIHRTKEQAIAEARDAAGIIGLQLKEIDHPAAQNGSLAYDVCLMHKLEGFIHLNNIQQVFTHWPHDLNTDHAMAAKITSLAARNVPKLLAYRSNWYQYDRPFNGSFFVDVSSTMELKINSLEAYSTEIKNRSRDWIESFVDRNRSDGFAVGITSAEVFDVLRWVA